MHPGTFIPWMEAPCTLGRAPPSMPSLWLHSARCNRNDRLRIQRFGPRGEARQGRGSSWQEWGEVRGEVRRGSSRSLCRERPFPLFLCLGALKPLPSFLPSFPPHSLSHCVSPLCLLPIELTSSPTSFSLLLASLNGVRLELVIKFAGNVMSRAL